MRKGHAVHLQEILTYTIIAIFALNACAVPQTDQTKTSTLTPDFKLQQLVYPDDPFETLPVKPDPSEGLELISQDKNVPVTLKVKRNFPKNLKTSVDNVSLVPAYAPQLTIPAKAGKQIKRDLSAETKSWKRWLTGYARTVFAELVSVQNAEMQKLNNSYTAAIADTADAKKKTKLTKDWNQAQKDLNKRYHTERQALRTALKSDRKNVKGKLESFYTQEAGFSVQFFSIVTLVAQIASNIATAVDNLNASLAPKDFQQVQSAGSTYSRVSPPPATSNIDTSNLGIQNVNPGLDYSYINPRAGGSYLQEPESVQVRTVDVNIPKRILDSSAMIQNFKDLQDKHPDFRALLLPFRIETILKNLKKSDGSPAITFDESERAQYTQCASEAITDATNVSSTCDYALISRVDSINWQQLRLDDQPLPNWLKAAEPKRLEHDFSLVFTLKYAPSGMSLAEWMDGLMREFFPKTYDLGNNASELRTYLNNKQEIYFEVKSPVACDQNADLTVSTPEVVSLQVKSESESVLFDGDYTFNLGFIDTNKQNQKLAEVKVEKLSEKLAIAAHQKYTKAYTFPPGTTTPNQKLDHIRKHAPLTMQDSLSNVRHRLDVQILNRTGNLFDIAVEKVGLEQCSLYYRGDCINGGDVNFQLGTKTMESGRYRVKTRYPTAKDVNQNLIRGINANKADSANLTDRQGYDFLVLNGAYSTFARYSNLPESVLMFSNFTRGESISGSNLELKDFKDSYSAVEGQVLPENYLIPSRRNFPIIDPAPNSNAFAAPIVQDAMKVLKANNPSLLQNTVEADYRLAMKHNLLFDLGAGMYQFEEVEFTKRQEGYVASQFLNVGAVVSFVNKDFDLNRILRNEDSFLQPDFAQAGIPMLLQVVGPTSL